MSIIQGHAMPNWNDVLDEIRKCGHGLDIVRRNYLKKLNKITGRNVIAYYSGWLQRPGIKGVDITDLDKNGFMNAVHRLDRSKGLDLILHTPGGDVAATQSIVDYLHRMFGRDIRAIIPQLAMSAGTMLACACRSILMGKESNIGPFDPSFNGIPAAGIVEEFERAMIEIKADPSRIPIWQAIIGRYHPTFIGQCEKAIRWAEKIVKNWLEDGMFLGRENAADLAGDITGKLIKLGHDINHTVHISIDQCEELGLVVEHLEENNKLQDTVLTIHHAYMHTFANSASIKIVENHLGRAIVNMANQ